MKHAARAIARAALIGYAVIYYMKRPPPPPCPPPENPPKLPCPPPDTPEEEGRETKLDVIFDIDARIIELKI